MFSNTIAALKPALSLIPITSTTVIAAVIEDRGQIEPGHAGLAVRQGHRLQKNFPFSTSKSQGAEVNRGSRRM